jgi:DNA replication protein DnaC
MNATIAMHGHQGWNNEYTRLLPKLIEGGTLSLLGERGVGKTQMAVCWLLAASDLGLSVRYCTAVGLFRELRRCFNSGGPGEVATIRTFTQPDLLVIDEAHESSGTPFELRTLTDIIDNRYHEFRGTVLIANQSEKEAADTLGSSIVSRINETGEVVTLQWASFREQ